MSAVFGFVHFDVQAADSGHLTAMAQAIADWRLAPAVHKTSGPIAMGARLLTVTDEDAFEAQPLETERHILVASVRLDNRTELQRALCLGDCAGWPDSRFVLAAFEKWGHGCCDRLLGDWCFAVWDKTSRSLFLARDAAGNTGLYWWHNGKTAVFSSALRALIGHPGVPDRPNALMVACFLTRFDDPETECATAYAEVSSVAPGSWIQIDSAGVRRGQWWHPEALGELRWPNRAQYFEAFLELYEEAVACRLRAASSSKIALALSSGLDSTSVMALAAPVLARRNAPLHAYVHRPMHGVDQYDAGLLIDEFKLAQEAAFFTGNVAVKGLRHEASGWLAGIEESFTTHGQYSHSATPHYWISDLMRHAASDGASVLLTGQGGNGTVSWPGLGNLWPTVLRGHFGRAARELWTSRMPLKKAVRVQLLSPVKQVLRRQVVAWSGPTAADWAAHSIIRPEFAREINLVHRMRQARHDLENSPPFRPDWLKSWRLHGAFGGAMGARWSDMANLTGIAVRDPTRDRRLVEFCWRVPDAIFWNHGDPRAMVRHAMAPLLPRSITHARQKGFQCADLTVRARAEGKALQASMELARSHALLDRWIDVDRLQKDCLALQNMHGYGAYRLIFTKIAPVLSLSLFVKAQR